MLKRCLLGLNLLLITITVMATPIIQGTDYDVITTPLPKTVAKNGEINVKEFFSFACIHCKVVEPLVQKTILPNKKVALERIQVVWDDNTAAFAKLNATYQILDLENLYIPTFNAVFANQDLNDPKTLSHFLSQNNVNKSKFMAMYNSFTVSTKISQYKELMKLYNVSGTPTFVVADKYIIKPASPQRLMQVLQYLINKASKVS